MAFEKYKNLSGRSGVYKYEFTEDGITVMFSDQSWYKYHASRIGANNIAHMKVLANAGAGLNTIINRTAVVKTGYSEKGRGLFN